MFFSIFRHSVEQTENPKIKDWRASQRAQLKNRIDADFYPVPDRYLAQHGGLGDTRLHSTAFHTTFGALRSLVLRVLPLRHSIKEFALWGLIDRVPSCPSVVFDDVCRQLQELTDAAIRDIPTELLVYLASNHTMYFSGDSFDENLDRLNEQCGWQHQAVEKYKKMAHDYLAGLNESGRASFVAAMDRLWHAELMLDDEVAPVALDVFPSIALRENEIKEAHLAMQREFAF